MNGIAFIIVLVCAAAAQANPFGLLKELSPITAGIPVFTAEDTVTYTRIIEQDESLLSTFMTENLADYGLLLNSRVIAAYNVSQIKGECATIIERQTNKDWYGIINAIRQQINSSTELVRKALFTATPEQYLPAIQLYAEHRNLNLKYLEQFVNNLNLSYAEAVKGICTCDK